MEKIKGRKPYINLQHDQTDCGVACLQSIVNYYGGSVGLEVLRERSGTNTQGTTLLGLWQAAQESGFTAEGCQADITALREHGKPTILHIELPNKLQHYIIYYGEKKGKAIIGDPGKGMETLRFEDLDLLWKSKKCLTLEPNEIFENLKKLGNEKKTWLKQLIIDDMQLLVSSTFLGLLVALLGLSAALFNQVLIDKILPDNNFEKLYQGIWMLTTLLLVQVVFRFLRGWLLTQQQKMFQIRIVSSFFERLLALPKSFFDTRKKGDLIARLNDTARIQNFISQLAGSFVIEFLLLLSSLGFLFVYNVDSGLITLAIIPVYVGFIFIARPYITSAQNQVMVGFAESQSNYVDTLSGIEVIKNHDLSDIYNHQNLTIYERFQDKVLKMSKLSLKINLVTGFLGTFYLVIIILNASSRVMNDNFSIGQLVAVFTVASGIIPLTAHLTFMMVSFKEAEIAFNRMFELVHYKGTRKNGLKTIDSFQHLTLERISFRYPGRSLLLHDFSLQVKKGKITALIGESGCGKSTLTGILQGFYPIEQGLVKINNLPLDEIASSPWHKKLGVVPQNIHIFNETLFFNITHMKPSKELLELFDKFLLKYGLNTYFNQFPDHVFTLVGENGLSLSGGQQQMVAFLRALYHEPELLILDEFTSAMDTISERLVYKLLNQIKPDMGILLITHRLHSIRYLADEICVIEKGSVQNKGTHDELMQGRNFYSHYWNTMLNPDYASINQQ